MVGLTKVLSVAALLFGADAKKAAFVKSTVCGSITPLERESVEAINILRTDEGLNGVSVSPALTHTAKEHLKDLKAGKIEPGCTLHSWTDGDVACCERSDATLTDCTLSKAQELADFPGVAYEAIFVNGHPFHTGAVEGLKGKPLKIVDEVVDMILASPYPGAKILNVGAWRGYTWKSIGLALDSTEDGTPALMSVWMSGEEDSSPCV